MEKEILQRAIWNCNRDTEGRLRYCCCACTHNRLSEEKIKQRKEMPRHWFLIISKESTGGFVTALPISSKIKQIDLNGGETIKDEDITYFSKSPKKLPFRTSKTLVLCNKPCRIPVEELKVNEDYGMVKKDRYKHLIMMAQSHLTPN